MKASAPTAATGVRRYKRLYATPAPSTRGRSRSAGRCGPQGSAGFGRCIDRSGPAPEGLTIPQSRFASQPPLHKGAFGVRRYKRLPAAATAPTTRGRFAARTRNARYLRWGETIGVRQGSQAGHGRPYRPPLRRLGAPIHDALFTLPYFNSPPSGRRVSGLPQACEVRFMQGLKTNRQKCRLVMI